jgi:hypothetical protein
MRGNQLPLVSTNGLQASFLEGFSPINFVGQKSLQGESPFFRRLKPTVIERFFEEGLL